jgi:hypothetical protein
VLEVVEILRMLLEIGFLDGKQRPMVSFEVKPREGQDPLLLIANGQRIMRRAWALV